ncbi:MAG: VWA domain-containing protein [Micromonospora sp.]
MRSRGAGAAAAATALAVVVAGSWFGYQQLAGPSCSGQIELSLAAAPEIAPAVKAAADQWVSDGAAVGGTCIAVDVTSAESVEVAAAVATKHGATLGVGEANGTAVTPDVWVPDSSSWLLRLKNGGATAFAPANGASIARSPVVVAVPEPVASTKFGWPNRKLTWTQLLGAVTSSKPPLRAGIVEPTRDAAGLSGLLSLSAAASSTGADPQKAQEAMTGALRALATGSSSLRQDLLNRFPRSSDPTAIANSLNAAALSEEDVMAYNATKPPIPLAALYLDPPPVPLDYPFAVLPGIEPAKASAARVLFEVLTTPGFRNRLAAQSLRGPDGNWGDGFKAPEGAPSPAGGSTTPPTGQGGTAGLDPGAIQRVTSTWAVATLSGRMLAVIDVSGSMKKPVATANNVSREAVTVAAASRGLNLFDDSWSIGLWTFSTELVGSQDWKPLVPIKPLSANRGKLQQELAGIRPKDNGNTGLFDTVLAAYKEVQREWEPGRVNSVVLFTDGKNEDTNGISRAALLQKLKEIKDPEQPVRVIIIGIGTEVSKVELESIAKEGDGVAFVTLDPAKIGEIFLQAISQRPEAPR